MRPKDGAAMLQSLLAQISQASLVGGSQEGPTAQASLSPQGQQISGTARPSLLGSPAATGNGGSPSDAPPAAISKLSTLEQVCVAWFACEDQKGRGKRHFIARVTQATLMRINVPFVNALPGRNWLFVSPLNEASNTKKEGVVDVLETKG